MEKITKNTIIRKMAEINTGYNLSKEERLSYTYDYYGIYGIYQNRMRVAEGKAKEVYYFLKGFETAKGEKK